MEYTISWKSIWRLVIALGAIYLVWQLSELILIIMTSIMLAAAFYPVVKMLERRMSATLASILVFSLLLLPIILILFTFIPNLIEQFPDILRTVNIILDKSSIVPPSLKNIDLSQYGSNAASYLLQSTSRVTGFVTAFLTLVFLTLYFLIDSNQLLKLVLHIVGDNNEKRLKSAVEELIRINGHYIRGNLLISVICGVTIFIGLLVLRVPYAASLALFAAITDLLPLVGAFLGIIPAAIIGFAISPTVGILVIALFLVYQQFENNVISPNVYNQALDLSPALTFIAVLVGATLFGMLGAFIALPIAASIPTLVKYVKPKEL